MPTFAKQNVLRLGILLVLLVAAVVIVAHFPRKNSPPVRVPSYHFSVDFIKEDSGQIQTLDGSAAITGDCLDAQTRTSLTATTTLYGGVSCQLVKSGNSKRYQADEKTFLIKGISFFRDDDRTIYWIPITGKGSRSPLLLTGSSRLTVTFTKSGEITTSSESLPPTFSNPSSRLGQ